MMTLLGGLFCSVFVCLLGFGFWFFCEGMAKCFILKSPQSTLQPIRGLLSPEDAVPGFGWLDGVSLGRHLGFQALLPFPSVPDSLATRCTVSLPSH